MLKLLVLLVSTLLLSTVDGTHYGVLVAGSNGYFNYRHQTDICHAFHVMVDHGVDPSNIIVMIYDDIANDPKNPFPGQMFNKPTDPGVPGVDVYSGCQKDYTGVSVTAEVFLGVLSGNTTAAPGPVLMSGPDDDVFLVYSDHGGVGLSVFPTGPLLYAEDLVRTLKQMHTDKKFKKMVIYWESCESGSMFVDLPHNLNIYVTTAANPSESSYGCYCPPDDDSVDGTELGSCLGDQYSVSWMEDADESGSMAETLETQYLNVKERTTDSHVMQYGDLRFVREDIGLFEGNSTTKGFNKGNSTTKGFNKGNSTTKGFNKGSSTTTKGFKPSTTQHRRGFGRSVDAREGKLDYWYWQLVRAWKQNNITAMRIAESHWRGEMNSQLHADLLFRNLVKSVLNNTSDEEVIQAALYGLPINTNCNLECRQLFDMFAIGGPCLSWTDYSLKYARTLFNLIQLTNPQNIIQALLPLCV